ARAVVPGVEEGVGDHLVGLVGGDVDRGVGGGVVVGVVAAAAGTQVVPGIGHVGVEQVMAAKGDEVRVVGAEVGEGAVAVGGAGADAVAQEDEELVSRAVAGPAVDGNRAIYLAPDLRVGEAAQGAAVGVVAAARGQGSVRPGARELL